MNKFLEDISDSRLIDMVSAAIYHINNLYLEWTYSDPLNTFSNGWCGYYAIMLHELFNGKAEYYTTTDKSMHAICKIGDAFYDVYGVKCNSNGVIHSKEDFEIKYDKASEEDFSLFLDILNSDKKDIDINRMKNICIYLVDEVKKIMNFPLEEKLNDKMTLKISD